MKKLLLISMGMMFLFASCKKSESENLKKEQLHDVKFDVAVFSQSIGNFPGQAANANPSGGKLMTTAAPQAATKLSNYIDRLDYFLYNAQGARIANMTISADTSEYGFTLPTAKLPEGSYTVVFVGSTGKNGKPSGISFNADGLDSFTIYNFLNTETPDIFFAKTKFEVGTTNGSVDVTLKRPGGKLKIVIEDEWPAGIDHIGLSINGITACNLNGGFSQIDKTGLTINKNYKWSNVIVNGAPVQTQTYIDCSWENFVLTNSTGVTTLNGVVTAYGKNNDVVVTKNLVNIRVEKNKITTVSGKLFDNIGLATKSSFNVRIDADLSGEIKQSF